MSYLDTYDCTHNGDEPPKDNSNNVYQLAKHIKISKILIGNDGPSKEARHTSGRRPGRT
jgi:hypothetical protein